MLGGNDNLYYKKVYRKFSILLKKRTFIKFITKRFIKIVVIFHELNISKKTLSLKSFPNSLPDIH